MPLSSKSLEHEYLLPEIDWIGCPVDLVHLIYQEFIPGRICPLALMPGRISAFKLREIDGIDVRSNLCIGIDARSNLCILKCEKLMELMPGRICALELMPGRIQSKMRQYTFTSTIFRLLINILFEKNQQSCTMKLKYIWEANRPVILNYYNFEFFNIFCLQSQLSGCIMHRLVEYSSKKEKN